LVIVGDRIYPPYLRLVWSQPASRPQPPRRPAHPVAAPAARPQARFRVNFAVAIERHLAGDDRLTDDEFVVLYATGQARAAVPPPSAS
jgi:hypothetical protein